MKIVIIVSVAAIAFIVGVCKSATTNKDHVNSAKDSTVFHASDTANLVQGAEFYQ